MGAIIFSDLSNNRIKDIVFSWEEALNFEGETGPYVQYTHARASSVLRKAGERAAGEELPMKLENHAADVLVNASEQALLKQLYVFKERLEQAAQKLEPSVVSRYLVDLAQSFNRFYHDSPILIEDAALRQARLALVRCTQITIRNGLTLIGLKAPEKM